MRQDDPRGDDTENRLRRTLHAQLDGAEPATPAASARAAGARRAARIPFGLVAAATSILVVAALVGSRLPWTGGGHPGATATGATVASPSIFASTMPAPVPPGLLGSAAMAPPAGIGTGAPDQQAASAQPAATAAGPAVASPSRVVPPPRPATAPPVPRSTPTATPAAQATGPVVVTLAQAGGTVDLAVGQHLELQFGTAYQWSISVTGSGILVAVPAPVPAGVQGIWAAERAGTASIRAVGNPLCLQAKPPCGMPSREFSVTVIVR
jgi:hypothetical protein